MKHIYFGIFIPLFVIIMVAVFSATDAGIKEVITRPTQISLDEVNPENCTYSNNEGLTVLRREINNNFFLTKNVEKNSQKFSFCIEYNDRTSTASIVESNSNAEDTKVSLGLDIYRYYEIKSGEKAVIESKLRHCSLSRSYYQTSEPINLLIIEKDDDRTYSSCYSLSEEDKENAIVIPIVD